MDKKQEELTRRTFLKLFGIGTGAGIVSITGFSRFFDTPTGYVVENPCSSGGSSGSGGQVSGGHTGVVGEAEVNFRDDGGATVHRSSGWPTPNSDGYDITMEFDEVVNAVDDLGWDPNGNELIDMESDVRDGRLIVVPEGVYLFNDNKIGGYNGPVGIVGDLDTDPSKIILRIEEGYYSNDGIFDSGGDTFLSSFTIDYREDEETGNQFLNGGGWSGDVIVEHIIQTGWEIPMNHFITVGSEPGDTHLYRNIDSRVPREKGDYKSETKNWFFAGRGFEGRAFHEGHEVHHATESTFYTGKHPGEVHIRNCKLFNSGGVAGIRNAGEDSSIYGCELVYDTDRWDTNNRNIESGANSEDDPFKHNRGIWLQSADVRKNGCWVENNTVEMRKTDHRENTSIAAMMVNSDTGGGTWRNNEIILGSNNVNQGFKVSNPSGEDAGKPDIEVDGLTIRGKGDMPNGAINIDRDGELKNLCIQTPNTHGIIAEGGKLLVQDSTINVGGSPISEQGASVTSRNIAHIGSCT